MKRGTMMVAAGALIIALGAAWTIARQARPTLAEGVLEASGRVEGEEILVGSTIGGRVSRLLVNDGDAVTEGQLIAILQSEELDARLRQADAGTETTRAQVAQAEGQVGALLAQLGQARTAVALTQAQVTAAQQQAQAALTAALVRSAQAQKALSIAQRAAPNAVREADAVLRAADADLARARAARDQAQRDLARLDALYAAGAVAAAQVDGARAALDAAAAQVDAAAAQRQRALVAREQATTGLLDVDVREEEIRAAAAAVEAARSQVKLSQAGALDVTRQQQQQQVVEQQLRIARGGLAAARAQDRAVVAARDELQSTRREASVYAPRAGVVVHRVVNQGEVVPPGGPIVVLVDLQALWVKVYVPEPDLGRIRLGLPARVSVDAYPGRSFEAKVTEISERAEFTPKDVQTREDRVKQVFAVKLSLDNREGIMKPGMPADAAILWKETAAP